MSSSVDKYYDTIKDCNCRVGNVYPVLLLNPTDTVVILNNPKQ
jgi:hypothetical protein